MTGIAGPRTARVRVLMADAEPVRGPGHAISPPESGR